MRIWGVLSVIFFGINSAAAVTHSLRYLHTAASGIPAFPEFVTVVLVDGQPFSYYDSSIRRELPRQTWTVQTEDPDFWERRIKSSIVDFKSKVEMIKPSFNQTLGVHIIQLMYGCEWDDETGSIKGWWQFGYNGEDLMALDLKTNTGTAPTPAATFHKHKRDKDKGWAIRMNTYLSQGCPDQLKKYVSYGKSTLLRTETPSVFLLQKNFLSPVRCHATGFYPNRAVMFWRKDGKEITEGMSTDLKLLLDTTEKKRYECVFQLSGANESIITKLEQSKIKTNGANPYEVTISVVIAVIIFVAVIADWLIVYKGRKAADHLNVKKQMHL
uniref:Ig-like domain-containing protein n=1 Tax=Oryzias latipes TaxID=8090 RepID=A0A3P9LCG9_ORYLA